LPACPEDYRESLRQRLQSVGDLPATARACTSTCSAGISSIAKGYPPQKKLSGFPIKLSHGLNPTRPAAECTSAEDPPEQEAHKQHEYNHPDEGEEPPTSKSAKEWEHWLLLTNSS
jgi:hypothetical protein